MHYKVTHRTVYEYEEPINLCHNLAMLQPRSTDSQICKRSNVNISPQPDVMSAYEDFFGNKLLYFAIQQEHRVLDVTVTSYIENTRVPGHTLEPDANNLSWEEVQQLLSVSDPQMAAVRQFIPATPMTAFNDEVRQYALQSFTPNRSISEASLHLMRRIYQDFKYSPGFSTIATPVAEIMRNKKGVCQDFAHLAIACIRSLGLAVRYVSGYIETTPANPEAQLVGADASHAWFAVFVPEFGWLDFDPTNNQMPSTQHITIGWGRDYADVTPLKGVILSSGSHKLSVAVEVKRI